MQRGAWGAIIVGVALVTYAPGFARAHTSAPFVSFGHGKRQIAIFTKSECLHGVHCKSRVDTAIDGRAIRSHVNPKLSFGKTLTL